MSLSGKVLLNYGAMSGLSSFGFFLLLYYMGVNPLGMGAWLGSWIPIVFICLATGFMRNKVMGGFITYRQALRIGFLTAVSSGFLFALLVYIFGTVIQPGLIEEYKAGMVADMEQSKSLLPSEMYETALENLEKATLFNIVSADFFYKCVGGFLVSLITAGFYKRINFNQGNDNIG
jgi:hypothetical protein